MLYVNRITGIVEEVDGDSYLINLDDLPDTPHGEDGPEWLDLTAEELFERADPHGAAEEIAR